ncbi:RIP metalloprotease RseP [Ammoniphilus sp. CFH 90114]|uniref:RIP metalloprotease RseP n=1 Tax=Ammoniphilus sp. CFH 90114 TaxID=2493665 RepID=UPI00100DC1F0|nr:RIP metalloprotease RseP [Ammoniphilus sp. CFH 90114]RXT15149.1 RIP metalloprotease RseP [Ammoniphilus sp. CFH 90114]
MFEVLSIILVFGALVFFHELGHLVFAKRAGILCREFALGMGPKLFSFKKGETTYTLRLLPIGGFVRMAGEDPEVVKINPGQEIGIILENEKIVRIIVDQLRSHPQAEVISVERIDLDKKLLIEAYLDGELHRWNVHPQAMMVSHGQEIQIAPWDRQFGSKTVRQRATAIFAGPAANFILAFILLMVMALSYGTPTNLPYLGEISKGGPAERAELKEGDRILQVNNQAVQSWQDIVTIVSQSPGQELTFIIERNKEQFTVPLVTDSLDVEGKAVGKIGVYPPVTKEFGPSLNYAGETTWQFSTLIFKGLGMLVTGKVSMDELSGPVGIFNYTYEAAERGMAILLKWSAILSINLGIINLLPLPALDGGRLVFLMLEAVRGRPVDPQKEGMVHFLGFAFLMLLILVITWNDIQRFFF